MDFRDISFEFIDRSPNVGGDGEAGGGVQDRALSTLLNEMDGIEGTQARYRSINPFIERRYLTNDSQCSECQCLYHWMYQSTGYAR